MPIANGFRDAPVDSDGFISVRRNEDDSHAEAERAASKLLALTEDDAKKLVVASTHLGLRNVDKRMQFYVYTRQSDGTFVFNLKKFWEKLLLAARTLVTIQNPAEIAVVAAREDARRAILKFCRYTGATPFIGRFIPGNFTNRKNPHYCEPRILLVNDSLVDRQAVLEASYVNIPTIAFCNTDASLRFVDIAIPCNNKSRLSIGLIYWLMARELLRLKGSLSRDEEWTVKPDLFTALKDDVEVQEEGEGSEGEETGDDESGSGTFNSEDDADIFDQGDF
ncbi:Ribosomal protein SA [Giardia muris]|uniref:Small ribosomal subunit protein uS2 n=1 Tax=Giardia muris TaxID=5742 RepID=A0A4Z1SRW1_GIAMU|nr:Ribosomal protein SA [Giardia muris]|eukprot:TNJ27725.1 Ribosomal protein SA [Giardia muris]